MPFMVFSQTNVQDEKSRDFWITAKVYPSLTRDANGSYSDEVNFEHSHRIAFSGGIELTKELVHDKWSLTTGLLFNDFGYKEKASSDFIPNYETRYTTRRAYYLTLPVSSQFHLKKFYFGLGLNLSYFLSETLIVDGEAFQNSSPSSNLETWLIGLNVKTGYAHELSDHFGLRFELYGIVTEALRGSFPTFIWENSNTGYYSFGLGIGLDYKL